ncbi:MAG: phenylphosphate carboxylase subunit delta [Phycisphaerales bacterium]|nr:MAG: phenylphosphate carboxylase subunit delta [Phycisphaerales bacterium]
MDFNALQLLLLDVDGVLTDGRLVYRERSDGVDEFNDRPSDEIKVFHVHDGRAIRSWLDSGRQVALISGRDGAAVRRRAAELGIILLRSAVSDKSAAFQALLRETGVPPAATIYVGDDAPDLGPMRSCGLPVAVANAAAEVKRAAVYVTRRRGGEGAVAEVIDWLGQKERAAAGRRG